MQYNFYISETEARRIYFNYYKFRFHSVFCITFFQNTVDKLVQRANASLLIGTSSWKEQFMEAWTVSPGNYNFCCCIIFNVLHLSRKRFKVEETNW